MQKIYVVTAKRGRNKGCSPFVRTVLPARRVLLKTTQGRMPLAAGEVEMAGLHAQATAKLNLSPRMYKTYQSPSTRLASQNPISDPLALEEADAMFQRNQSRAKFGHSFPQRTKSGAHRIRQTTF
jgi:hypothetical protein